MDTKPMETNDEVRGRRLPRWLLALLPLLLLGLLVAAFLALDPLRSFRGAFPPLETLSVQRVLFPAPGDVRLEVINGGPEPVTIAQVMVDNAYWAFTANPGGALGRLESTTLDIPYPWVAGEPLPITLVTSTGLTFPAAVDVAVKSPQVNSGTLRAYALLGIYVGIVPIALGMLWYPFMRRVDRKWMNAVLALTIGLLVFLFVDTVLEALERAADVPGVFQGVPLVIFGMLLSLGVLLAIGRRSGSQTPLRVATLIALGIGLHNFGEGLAIGAAFATGAAALGSFLVVGFTLHNITEGVGIAAPLTRQPPPLRAFFLLALLAGGPAVLGTWVGSLAFSPLLAALFLGIGAGAIAQVIWEVGKLLGRDARRAGESPMTWLNFGGLAAGILIMYLTAFLVKF